MKLWRQLAACLPPPASLTHCLRTPPLLTTRSGPYDLGRLVAALLIVPLGSTIIALVPYEPGLIPIQSEPVASVGLGAATVTNPSSAITEARLEVAVIPSAAPKRAAPTGPAAEPLTAPEPLQIAEAPVRPTALELIRYAVAPGDTVWTIAERFRIAPEAVLYSNELADPDLLGVGQELLLPPVPGLLHKVQVGDSLASLASLYAADASKVAEANGLESPDLIRAGSTLIVPDGRVPAPPAPTAQPPAPEETKLADNLVEPEVKLPRPPAADAAQTEFILQAAGAARDSQRATGVPASVTVAQAILESDWGRSRLSAENNNFFGIKAQGRAGTAGVVNYDTWEVVDGQNVVVKAPFRAYLSMSDSFVDHGRFFLENRRYGGALKVANDAQAFARAIAAAGYATDPAYPDKLIALMGKFDLYAYDLR